MVFRALGAKEACQILKNFDLRLHFPSALFWCHSVFFNRKTAEAAGCGVNRLLKLTEALFQSSLVEMQPVIAEKDAPGIGSYHRNCSSLRRSKDLVSSVYESYSMPHATNSMQAWVTTSFIYSFWACFAVRKSFALGLNIMLKRHLAQMTRKLVFQRKLKQQKPRRAPSTTRTLKLTALLDSTRYARTTASWTPREKTAAWIRALKFSWSKQFGDWTDVLSSRRVEEPKQVHERSPWLHTSARWVINWNLLNENAATPNAELKQIKI